MSDALIFAAYIAIPAVLLALSLRRGDLPFRRIFFLFGAFIVACGLTHLLEVVTFWAPVYRLSGVVKALTALVSLTTVAALFWTFPALIALGRATELETENRALADAIGAQQVEIARSNRELDEFAYVASHDLKAPLRAIENLSRWIDEDARDALPETSREHFDKLRGRVQRMDRLLDDLLAYSRAGRRLADAEEVDCGQVVRGIVQLLDPPAGMAVHVAEDMPVLRTYRVPLETVLRNLIANALKHHDRESGRVDVSWRDADERFYELSVADDGPGIPEEFRAKVFGMFQTLRPRDEVEGSGIGLAIVKKIVERHGGEIAVGASEGRGAIFRFTWPKGVGRGAR